MALTVGTKTAVGYQDAYKARAWKEKMGQPASRPGCPV